MSKVSRETPLPWKLRPAVHWRIPPGGAVMYDLWYHRWYHPTSQKHHPTMPCYHATESHHALNVNIVNARGALPMTVFAIVCRSIAGASSATCGRRRHFNPILATQHASSWLRVTYSRPPDEPTSRSIRAFSSKRLDSQMPRSGASAGNVAFSVEHQKRRRTYSSCHGSGQRARHLRLAIIHASLPSWSIAVAVGLNLKFRRDGSMIGWQQRFRTIYFGPALSVGVAAREGLVADMAPGEDLCVAKMNGQATA